MRVGVLSLAALLMAAPASAQYANGYLSDPRNQTGGPRRVRAARERRGTRWSSMVELTLAWRSAHIVLGATRRIQLTPDGRVLSVEGDGPVDALRVWRGS
jgi:hypothetical protein